VLSCAVVELRSAFVSGVCIGVVGRAVQKGAEDRPHADGDDRVKEAVMVPLERLAADDRTRDGGGCQAGRAPERPEHPNAMQKNFAEKHAFRERCATSATERRSEAAARRATASAAPRSECTARAGRTMESATCAERSPFLSESQTMQ